MRIWIGNENQRYRKLWRINSFLASTMLIHITKAERQNLKCIEDSNHSQKQMSPTVRKHISGNGRPVKIQISLCIRAVWSESSLGALWIAKNTNFLHADNEDSDQTARMRRLIWVFIGRTCKKVHFLTLLLDYWGNGTAMKLKYWPAL